MTLDFWGSRLKPIIDEIKRRSGRHAPSLRWAWWALYCGLSPGTLSGSESFADDKTIRATGGLSTPFKRASTLFWIFNLKHAAAGRVVEKSHDYPNSHAT